VQGICGQFNNGVIYRSCPRTDLWLFQAPIFWVRWQAPPLFELLFGHDHSPLSFTQEIFPTIATYIKQVNQGIAPSQQEVTCAYIQILDIIIVLVALHLLVNVLIPGLRGMVESTITAFAAVGVAGGQLAGMVEEIHEREKQRQSKYSEYSEYSDDSNPAAAQMGVHEKEAGSKISDASVRSDVTASKRGLLQAQKDNYRQGVALGWGDETPEQRTARDTAAIAAAAALNPGGTEVTSTTPMPPNMNLRDLTSQGTGIRQRSTRYDAALR
jgi:hypothetical protein